MRKCNGTQDYLMKRQLGFCSRANDLKLVKRFYSPKSEKKFTSIFKKSSKKNIVYLANSLFFDSFTEVYSNDGILKYKLPVPTNRNFRIIHILAYEVSLHYPTRNQLIALIENGFLQVYDLYSGELTQCILTSLFEECKFKYLEWDISETRFYLKSVWNNNDRVYIAIFNVEPFQLIAKFYCSKYVFGKDLTNISIFDGILQASFKNDVVKFYSLEDIILNNVILDPSAINLNQLTANRKGIPDTHKIISEPPVIFEKTSYQGFIEFGHNPVVLISSPEASSFCFRMLRSGEILGTISSSNLFDELYSSCYFFDNYYRTLLRRQDSVSVFEIESTQETNVNSKQEEEQLGLFPFQRKRKLNKVFEIRSSDWNQFDTATGDKIKESPREKTSRIQTRKRKESKEELITTEISSCSFEDELEILVITISGKVFFFDSNTGKCIYSMKLNFWSDLWDHCVLLDRDILIHFSSVPGLSENQVECYRFF